MQQVFLSQLLHRAVHDTGGNRLGHLQDIIVDVSERRGPPPVSGLIVRHAFSSALAPLEAIVTLGSRDVVVDAALLRKWTPQAREQNQLYVRCDLLDRSFIALSGPALYRANDVQLQQIGRWHMAGVDVSVAALLRRFRLLRSVATLRPQIVPWRSLEIFRCETRAPHLFGCLHPETAQLHPSDLAQLLLAGSYAQREEIIGCLDEHGRIRVLEVLSPEMRLSVLSALDEDTVIRLLDHMEPNLAAAILKKLPPEQGSRLLGRLQRRQTEYVAWLLSHPDNSAGAMMRTDIVALPQTETADAVLTLLHNKTFEGLTDPIYVTDRLNTRNLRGVVSLRALLEAEPDATLEDIMDRKLVVRRIEDDVDQVARAMAHYNMTVMPILDERNQLVGVVTLDDALEHFLPDAWLKRMPRVLT
jgi:CBS domain-containing protein/sporulation protein YlmC with PRC-barrel domain